MFLFLSELSCIRNCASSYFKMLDSYQIFYIYLPSVVVLRWASQWFFCMFMFLHCSLDIALFVVVPVSLYSLVFCSVYTRCILHVSSILGRTCICFWANSVTGSCGSECFIKERKCGFDKTDLYIRWLIAAVVIHLYDSSFVISNLTLAIINAGQWLLFIALKLYISKILKMPF